MKEEIAIVNEAECTDLLRLFKHRQVLERLKIIMGELEVPVGERWKEDFALTDFKIDSLWKELSEKYNFKTVKGAKWTIDFQTRKIYLIN